MNKGCVRASSGAIARAAFGALESLEQRQFLSAAALDTGYGSGGVARTDFPGTTNDRAADIVSFGTGLLTIGNASNRAVIVKYNANETRDTSFGDHGLVSIPSNILSSASRVQIDSHGKIVIAGSRLGVAAVARFNADGTVDASFGNRGVATQAGIGSNATGLGIANSGTVIISGDGMLVSGANPETYFTVASFTSVGAVDHTFTDGSHTGYVVSDFSAYHDAGIADIAMEGNQIVAMGTIDPAEGNTDVEVARYNNDGSLDPSFFTTGSRRIDVSNNNSLNLTDRGVAVAVSGSKIIIGAQNDSSAFTAVRLNDDGSTDTTFASASSHPGFAYSTVNGGLAGMAVDSSGNILLVGGDGTSFQAAHITSAGAQDWTATQQLGSYESGAGAAVINNDGSAALFGSTFPDSARADYAFVNLNASGGVVNTVVDGLIAPEHDVASVMAVGSDGSAIVAGLTSTEDDPNILAIAKYAPDGNPDGTFAGGSVTLSLSDDIALVAATSDGGGGAYLVGNDSTTGEIVSIHITATGDFDTGYGVNGFANAAPGVTAQGAALASDGSLLIAGYSGSTGAVVKLDDTGSPASGFGSSGVATVDLGGSQSLLTSITELPDHTILVAGANLDTAEEFAAAHLNASGNLLDQGLNGSGTFGTGGVALGPATGAMAATSLAFDASTGAVYLGGGEVTDIDNNISVPLVAKLDANGNLDSGYGTNGIAEPNVTNDLVKSIVLQNGKALFVTSAAGGVGSGAQVVRLDESGSLDSSFDDDGIAPVNTPAALNPVGLSLAPSNRILIGGTLDDDFAVAALSHIDASNTNNPPTVSIQGNTTSDAAPTTGSEGTSIHLTSIANDPDAGDSIATYLWSVVGGPVSSSSDPSAAEFTFTPGDNGSYQVSLTVTDTHGAQTTAMQTINVANLAPVIDSATNSGPVNEGSSVTINVTAHDAAGANDPLTISYDYGSGYVSSNTHIFADNNAIGFYNVNVKVDDGDGGITFSSTQVTVNNVAPTASVTGPTSLKPGQVGTFTLGATDPSSVDQAASFTFHIDWDGNGTIDQTVTGPAGTQVPHAYSTTGAMTVKVTATDKDGGTSASPATLGVNVAAPTVVSAQLQSDPLNPGQQMLLVNGTNGADNIKLTVNNRMDTVSVQVNGVVVGTYSPTSRIVVYGGDGNDSITHGGGFSRAVELYGGAGNDTLTAGQNGDILVGGAGDDSLVAGLGNDLLIGGGGSDKLAAGGGEDILIAGTTAFDNDPASLNAISAEWQSSRTFQSRIANLMGNNPNTADFNARLNGTVYLLADVPNATVFDDGDKDTTNGGSGSDWFFVNISGGIVDKVSGAGSTAVVTDIS